MEEQMSDATGKKEHLTAVMLDAVLAKRLNAWQGREMSL